MVVGCGKETEQKKNPYFQATVLEVKENSILVEPFEGEQELTSVDRISVSTDVISIQEVPEMEEGTEVRVVYNGGNCRILSGTNPSCFCDIPYR